MSSELDYVEIRARAERSMAFSDLSDLAADVLALLEELADLRHSYVERERELELDRWAKLSRERWCLLAPGASITERGNFGSGCDRRVEWSQCPAGMAYIVDPDTITYTDLRTGVSRTLRQVFADAEGSAS